MKRHYAISSLFILVVLGSILGDMNLEATDVLEENFADRGVVK